MKDLHDHVVREVAHKWSDLGVQLLKPRTINIIKSDHPHDSVECCKCVLTEWLDTSDNATWNQLIEAIRSVGLVYVANELSEHIVSIECEAYSNYIHIKIDRCIFM